MPLPVSTRDVASTRQCQFQGQMLNLPHPVNTGEKMNRDVIKFYTETIFQTNTLR